MILQDHLIKVSSNKKSLGVRHHSGNYCGHRQCASRDIMFLLSYKISENHVIISSCGCMDGTEAKFE